MKRTSSVLFFLQSQNYCFLKSSQFRLSAFRTQLSGYYPNGTQIFARKMLERKTQNWRVWNKFHILVCRAKIDRRSEMFFGNGRFFIASALTTKGRISFSEILNPKQSISFWKNSYFPAFGPKFVSVRPFLRLTISRLHCNFWMVYYLSSSPWIFEFRWAYWTVPKLSNLHCLLVLSHVLSRL